MLSRNESMTRPEAETLDDEGGGSRFFAILYLNVDLVVGDVT